MSIPSSISWTPLRGSIAYIGGMETLRVEVIVWNSPLDLEPVACSVEGPALGLAFFSFFSGERFDFFNAG